MNFEIYNESAAIISESNYRELKERIQNNLHYKLYRTEKRRVIHYSPESFEISNPKIEKAGNCDYYSICIVNDHEYQIFLEKYSLREGTTYHQTTYLSICQALKILDMDIHWMKESEDYLIQDFYRQLTINKLHITRIMDVEQESYHLGYSPNVLMFDTSISSTTNINNYRCEHMLLDCLEMKEHLEDRHVRIIYRRNLPLSKVWTTVLEKKTVVFH